VLEIMHAILDSGRSGKRRTIASTIGRPLLVPLTSAEDWREHG